MRSGHIAYIACRTGYIHSGWLCSDCLKFIQLSIIPRSVNFWTKLTIHSASSPDVSHDWHEAPLLEFWLSWLSPNNRAPRQTQKADNIEMEGMIAKEVKIVINRSTLFLSNTAHAALSSGSGRTHAVNIIQCACNTILWLTFSMLWNQRESTWWLLESAKLRMKETQSDTSVSIETLFGSFFASSYLDCRKLCCWSQIK